MLDILLWPFLACVVIALLHCWLGLHVVSRGVIFVDLALAQLATLGATLPVLFGHELHGPWAQVGGLALTGLGAALFAFVRLEGEQVPQEAFIGVLFAVASSCAILVLSRSPHGQEELEASLVGSVLFVTAADVLRLALVSAAVAVVHVVFRRRFLLLSTDPGGARRQGLRVRAWDFLFYLTFGVVITNSVRVAGVLLVFCFLVVPASCAILLTRGLGQRLAVGWVLAIAGSLGGLLLSARYDLPTGAAIVATFGAIVAVVLVLRALRSGSSAAPA